MNPESLDATQRAAREQFSRQSRLYGSGHILADTSDVAQALAEIRLPAVADVLDVAAGAGHTGLHLAGLGHRITLADISPAMLDRVREAAIARGLNVELCQHAAESLPYADGIFDLVTCRVAAHHFSSPPAFLRESSRVLRPGGWFLLIDGSVADGVPEAEEWIHRLERLRDPSHGRFLTPSAWRALCKDAGLAVHHTTLHPLKQPDLDWYFETAATPSENRREVLALIANAPAAARRVFQINTEAGKITWWWPRLTLIARKPEATEDR